MVSGQRSDDCAALTDRDGQREMEQTGIRLEDMLLVDVAYLDAAHDEMVHLAGSVDGYLRTFLGINDDLAG